MGVVKTCPGGEFAQGTKVVAFMGGLGRTISGSYVELTNPPVTNTFPVKADMPWEDLAVIPESYATAWTCLLRNLEIRKGQTLVIRGATSALGRAALNIAHDVGATIIATTRKKERFDVLKELGDEFGISKENVHINVAAVRVRKREMVRNWSTFISTTTRRAARNW